MACKDNSTSTSAILSQYADISKSLNSAETEISVASTPDEIQKANTVLKSKLVDLNKQLLAVSKSIIPAGDHTTASTPAVNLDEQEKKLDAILQQLKDMDSSYQLESGKEYTRQSQVANIVRDKHILKYWYYAFGFLNFLMIMILVIYVMMLKQ